jgi:hypothetical protein
VLRLSEEQLSGGVLDDSCLAVIARGCTQLQELELVQVSDGHAAVICLLPLGGVEDREQDWFLAAAMCGGALCGSVAPCQRTSRQATGAVPKQLLLLSPLHPNRPCRPFADDPSCRLRCQTCQWLPSPPTAHS